MKYSYVRSCYNSTKERTKKSDDFEQGRAKAINQRKILDS